MCAHSFGVGRIVRSRRSRAFYRVLEEYTQPVDYGGKARCVVRREFDYENSGGVLFKDSNMLELVTAEMTPDYNFVAKLAWDDFNKRREQTQQPPSVSELLGDDEGSLL